MNASVMAPGVSAGHDRARGAIHRQEHDVAGRVEFGGVVLSARPSMYAFMKSIQIGSAATAPVSFVADRLLLVEAGPDADGDVGIEADEPGVGVVVDRAGLSGERPVEARRPLRAVPRCTTPRSRFVITNAVSARMTSIGSDAVLLEQVAVAIDDLQDRRTASSGRPGSETPCRRSSPRAASPSPAPSAIGRYGGKSSLKPKRLA